MVSSLSTCNADVGGVVSTAVRAEVSELRQVASKRDGQQQANFRSGNGEIKKQAHLKPVVWTKTRQYLAGGAELGVRTGTSSDGSRGQAVAEQK